MLKVWPALVAQTNLQPTDGALKKSFCLICLITWYYNVACSVDDITLAKLKLMPLKSENSLDKFVWYKPF